MKVIDFINEWTGKLVCWLIFPQIFALVYEVTARYIFHSPTLWSTDVTYMIYGTHFLMGGGYTLLYRRHIKVDVWYTRWSPLWQAVVHLICYLIFFFPIIVALVYGSVPFTYKAWSLWEKSIVSPWRPVLFPFKAVMIVSFSLLFLQGISEFLRLVTSIRGSQ